MDIVMFDLQPNYGKLPRIRSMFAKCEEFKGYIPCRKKTFQADFNSTMLLKT